MKQRITYPHANLPLAVIIFILAFIGCGADAPIKKATKINTKTNIPNDMDTDSSSVLAIEDEFELAPDHSFPYNLAEPISTFKLPNKLKEISGLGIDKTGKYLYAVQDEEGILFIINANNGDVEKKIDFHKSGDYEGVEFVNNKAYIVKSSGTLYEVLNVGEENQELIKHKFTFNKHSDIEGLGYDPIENRLLISCKGKPGKGDDYEFKKGIFSFNIDSMQLDEKPAFTISVEAVKSFLDGNHHILEKVDKLIKLFQPGEEFVFGPSGIAVHPQTNNVYIISSVGKLLVVLNRKGKIKHIIKLKKKIHQQPEGIVFDSTGTLYISNEGKEGKARIYKFAYNK